MWDSPYILKGKLAQLNIATWTVLKTKLPQKVLYQLHMLKADNQEQTVVPKLCQLLGKHISELEIAGGELYTFHKL